MTAPAAPPMRRTAAVPVRLVVDASASRGFDLGATAADGPWPHAPATRSRSRAPPATACSSRATSPGGIRPRVVAALRSLPDDTSVLVNALDAATHLDGTLTVLHGVPLSFGERTVGRAEALRHGQHLLEQAHALLDGPGADVTVEIGLIRAWPHEIVGELLHADLLVLVGPWTGSVGHLGLVAASAFRHAPCAVLLAPRPAFRFPVLPGQPIGAG